MLFVAVSRYVKVISEYDELVNKQNEIANNAWNYVQNSWYNNWTSYLIEFYNNFPWPNPTDKQKAKIEQTAQAILDARALYPDSSLADLYDEVSMPPELRKAHQENDRAVMRAYGLDPKVFGIDKESLIVAELFNLYKKLTQ